MKTFIFILSLALFPLTHAQPIQYKRLNTEALKIVKNTACATCHTENLPTTKPDALNIFNLSNENWAGNMEVPHLERLVWSLKGANLDEIRAMAGEDIEIKPLNDDQKQVLDDFLALEKERRQKDPLSIFLSP